jgi:hypothetical protein
MTIKVGTRVRVNYEATVIDEDVDGTFEVEPDMRWPGEYDGWLHPSRFEVIPEPLRVGDVITADSPEPSTVVTLVNNHGDAVRYSTNGTIATTWRDQNCTSWHDFIRVHGSSGAWTVQHVGEGHS